MNSVKALILTILLSFALLFQDTASAANQNLRVGVGTGCTHAALSTALVALQGEAGTHTIRINKGNYAVPDGMTYTPTVYQNGVYLEGGYENCTAGAPTGSTSSDADRAVFNGSGGAKSSVLDLSVYGQIGTFQIRRIVLTGGDATNNVNDYAKSGGGLMVRGQASVLIGLGTTIRDNTAVNGGGVALAGSYQTVVPSVRADLFIIEGAEISNNIASNSGGGIYCGGANPVTGGAYGNYHGSIVLSDGTLSFNQATQGGAFFCMGTLEGGGGFQPRPSPGKVAWIFGNQASGGSGCAAGIGTLDTGLPVEGDGYRHLGAAVGSNGLLAITNNSGTNPGLCLSGSRSRTAINDPAPGGQSRFRLRNLYVTDQSGSGSLGLNTSDSMDLIVEPSGDNSSCTFFSATPCVRFNNNAIATGNTVGYLLFAGSGSKLQLQRAMITGNITHTSLALAQEAQLIFYSSILDSNSVAPSATAPNTSALFAARLGGRVSVRNSTAIMRTPLSQFFRLGSSLFLEPDASIVEAQASIFASTVGAPINVGYEGDVPTTNFWRYWCGYFQSTADFASHTVINNPVTGSFEVLAPSAFSLNAAYAPLTAGLRDACPAPSDFSNRDFYGRPYDVIYEQASPAHADIGAVEAQIQEELFSNGFEN